MRREQSQQIAIGAVLAFLAVTSILIINTSPPKDHTGHSAASNVSPDPHLSRPLGRWALRSDLANLHATVGRSPSRVLQLLGHPKSVRQIDDGCTIWEYDWQTHCSVPFRSGVVVATFYTAGF